MPYIIIAAVAGYLLTGIFISSVLVDKNEPNYAIYIMKVLVVMCLYPFMALAAWAIKDLE